MYNIKNGNFLSEYSSLWVSYIMKIFLVYFFGW